MPVVHKADCDVYELAPLQTLHWSHSYSAKSYDGKTAYPLNHSILSGSQYICDSTGIRCQAIKEETTLSYVLHISSYERKQNLTPMTLPMNPFNVVEKRRAKSSIF